MKRLGKFFVLTTVVAFILSIHIVWAGGSQEKVEEEVTEITYAHLGDWAKSIFEEAASEFEEETGVKVNLQYYPFQGAHEKYVTLIEADSLPDVGMGFMEWLGEFNERGIILPMDDYISEEYKNDIMDGIIEALSINGMLYASPFISSIRQPIMRGDLLEEAGIPVPANFVELLSAAKKIHNPPEMYGWGLVSGRNKNTVEFYLEILWPYGGEVLSKDGKRVAFNSPEGIAALEMFKSLAQLSPEGYLTGDIYVPENAFGAGNLFGMIDAGWIVNPLKENNKDAADSVVITPYLSGPAGNKANLQIVDAIMLFNEETAQISMEWIEFIKEKEELWDETYANFGLPPDLESQQDWQFMKSESAQLLGKAASYGRSKPTVSAWPQIEDALAVAIQKVCMGEATSAEALAKAEEISNEALMQ